jgi:DNA-directed RNA polymerase subunit RPC12/RpoP
MATAATTAEWICTRCGATNRKLVAVATARTADRCVTCHSAHLIEVDDRPVRWNARLDD